MTQPLTPSPQQNTVPLVTSLPTVPPGTPPAASGWSLSSMSSYLGPSKESFLGRCWAWIRGCWAWLWELFAPPKKPPGTQEISQDAVVSAQSTATPQKNELEEFIANCKGPIVRKTVAFYLRGGRYIGCDRRYPFGKTMRLLNGDTLKVAPKDVYCDVRMSDGSYHELPSSLFYQAKYENQLCFVWNEELFILAPNDFIYETLAGIRMVTSPEESLKTAEEEASIAPEVFRYDEDVPENYVEWYQGAEELVSIYLSPETRRIQPKIPGITPVDFSTLQPLPSCREQAEMRTSFTPNLCEVVVVAPGAATFDILLDGRRLMVFVDHSKVVALVPGAAVIGKNTMPAYQFGMTILPHKEKDLDLQGITSTFQTGWLRIIIPTLSTPNTPPSLQDTPQE
jgi:hypothetical protein